MSDPLHFRMLAARMLSSSQHAAVGDVGRRLARRRLPAGHNRCQCRRPARALDAGRVPLAAAPGVQSRHAGLGLGSGLGLGMVATLLDR